MFFSIQKIKLLACSMLISFVGMSQTYPTCSDASPTITCSAGTPLRLTSYTVFPRVCDESGGIKINTISQGANPNYTGDFFIRVSDSNGVITTYVRQSGIYYLRNGDGSLTNIQFPPLFTPSFYSYFYAPYCATINASFNCPNSFYLPLPEGGTYTYQMGTYFSGTFSTCVSSGTLCSIPDNTSQNQITLSATYYCGSVSIEASGAAVNSTFGNNEIYYDGVLQTPQLNINFPTYYFTVISSGQMLGSHEVKIKDFYGCTSSTNVTVDYLRPVVTYSQSSTCFGQSTGSISITSVTNGNPPYRYSIDNGVTYQSSPNFNGLSNGTYVILTVDALDCGLGTIVSVNSLPEIVPGAVVSTNPSCPGSNNGSITINGTSGGGGSFQYSRDGVNFSASNTFTGLSAGTYSITIRDANSCTTTINDITLTNPTPVAASYSSTESSCSSVNDGSISVISPSGGTGSYTYSLNYGAYTSFSTSSTFTGLPPGSAYVIKVRDGNNCEFTINNATVGVKPVLMAGITQTANINCFGQSTAALNLSVSNGTPGFTYQWYKNNLAITGPTGTGEDISGIGAGIYKVMVTDSKNCSTTSADYVVTEPTEIGATVTSSINVSCFGGSNGSINITPSGGTAPYTYLWSNGQTSEDITNLVAGNYTVTVTDSKGCTGVVSRLITAPAAQLSFTSTTKTNVTCFGANNGTITVAASGGTGGIEYSINSGTYQIGNVFSALTPGSYAVTARDANGCTQNTASISISSPAAALSISSITKTDPLCNGTTNGSFTIVATGGTAPYEFSSNGSTYVSSNVLSGLGANAYTLRVRDANGCIVNSSSQTLSNPAALSFNTTSTTPQSCATVVDGTISVNAIGGTGTKQYSINGSTFQSSGLFNTLTAGNYTVTVRDANLCTATTPVTVSSVPVLDGIISQTGFINCFGQSTAALSVSASGGTSPYTYVWSNGSVTTSANNLPASNHSVIITDNKGCSTTKTFTVTQPSQLTTTLTSSNYNGFGVSCQGASNGLINQTVTGGTAPYTYTWSNGATTKDIATLPSGLYSVNISDSRGCTTLSSVTLSSPTAVAVSLNTKTDVSCFNGNDGAISMLGTGGTGIYTYSRDAGTSWQASSSFSALAANSYTILIRDQNMCQTQTIVDLAQPALLTVTVNNINDATCGNANGSAIALGGGGTGDITYAWRNVNNDLITNLASLSNVGSGTYTVFVQDENACTTSTNVAISSTDGAQFSVSSITGVTCPTTLNGSAQVVIDNGQAPFNTLWSNGETGLSATALAGGTNSVIVRDGNGCEVIKTFTIPSPNPITVASIQVTSPSCSGASDAAVQVQLSGGTGTYTYEWNGISGGSTLSNILPGTYQLRVLDASSCELNDEIIVQDLNPITIDVVSQSTPTCATSTDGIVTVQAQGGNGTFNYNWSNNTTGAQITNISGGNYEVTAIDVKGCSITEIINLPSPESVLLDVNQIYNVSCNGLQDGSLTVAGSGGTGVFEYSLNNGLSWQSESSFANLPVNTYNLLVRDENGCTTSTTASITQPSPLAVNVVDIEPTTCNISNGSATGIPEGGTGDYTYEWLNTANQVVGSSAMLSSAPAGDYTLRIYDQNQCTVTSGVVIINSSTTSEIEVTSIEMTSCSDTADGAAILDVISGPGPHTVIWSSGEIGFSATQLQPGINTVSVTDANACVVTTTFQVPTPVPVSLSTQTLINPSCPGTTSGAIQVVVTGGAGNYNYSWNGNVGENNLQNIPAGTYQLTVTDANGCIFNQSLSLTDLPAIEITTTNLIPPTCAGGNDGQIAVTATGANGSFTYSWSNGFEGAIINTIAAGNYMVTATDQLGCSNTLNVVLTDPAPFVFDLGPDKVICVGQILVVTAPVDNASYVWTDSGGTVISTDRDVSITQAGDYAVLITDTNGCEAQDNFRVSTSNTLLTADFLAVSEAHEEDSILLIDISWPLPEMIEWNIPAAARVIERTSDYATIIFSEAGIYNLAVTARLGQCVSTYSRPITILSKELSTVPDGRQSTDDPLIKVFTAYPNPNQGDFKVSVGLGEPEVITLRLISLSQDVEVWRANHSETIHADFELRPGNLPVGLYFLILTVRDQTRMIRIIRN